MSLFGIEGSQKVSFNEQILIEFYKPIVIYRTTPVFSLSNSYYYWTRTDCNRANILRSNHSTKSMQFNWALILESEFLLRWHEHLINSEFWTSWIENTSIGKLTHLFLSSPIACVRSNGASENPDGPGKNAWFMDYVEPL